MKYLILFCCSFGVTLLLIGLQGGSAQSGSRHASSMQALTGASSAPAGAAQARTSQTELPLSDQELDDHIWAIQILATDPSTASVPALDHVLHSSNDNRERLEAVAALQLLKSDPAYSDAARAVLTRISTDAHPAVAARARAALAGS
jgi:hypothetical protein